MSVNGVTTSGADKAYNDYYYSNQFQDTKAAEEKAATDTAENTSGVIYEPSSDSADSTASTASTKKYKPDANMIARLKNDADNRKAQLMELVHKMMNGQTKAYGKANNTWENLRNGNFDADPATISQAQADVAEDGYWGASQTSQRILDFASALTGGDPDKIEEMREAFQKGYKMAEETWGGSLPELSQQTYDAVMAGFDQLKADAGL